MQTSLPVTDATGDMPKACQKLFNSHSPAASQPHLFKVPIPNVVVFTAFPVLVEIQYASHSVVLHAILYSTE